MWCYSSTVYVSLPHVCNAQINPAHSLGSHTHVHTHTHTRLVRWLLGTQGKHTLARSAVLTADRYDWIWWIVLPIQISSHVWSHIIRRLYRSEHLALVQYLCGVCAFSFSKPALCSEESIDWRWDNWVPSQRAKEKHLIHSSVCCLLFIHTLLFKSLRSAIIFWTK